MATSSSQGFSDAKSLSKQETIEAIESKVLDFLQSINRGEEPTLTLVNRTDGNTVRDRRGTLHLGQHRTTKRLLGSTQTFTKIWQILAFVYQLVQEGKTVTQREAYYCLVTHFRTQSEFNNILQDVVAFIGCTRSSLGICAAGSGGVAGLLLWKEYDGDWEDCSTTSSGRKVPGHINETSIQFKSMHAHCILVVEKDAVFNYLCGQRIWDSLPCILITGCGYPSLSVRTLLKRLQTQFNLPVYGLFDYNPHGMRILMTYRYGSTRMGTESHAYVVDVRWLGIHYSDLFEENGTPLVPGTSLQPWVASDKRVCNGLRTRLQHCDAPSGYSDELQLMERTKMKAEIEALNSSGMDALETKIIHKILCKKFY